MGDADCWATGCCDVSGYTCYETTEGVGQCMKNCTPSAGRLCTMPRPITDKIMQDAEWYGPSMYCFAYAMQDVGSTKPYYELELLAGQYQRKIGIFACEQWGAFSDKDGELAPGVPIVKIDDVDGDFHFAKRQSFGTWINTGHFTQVWKKIYADNAIGSSITWVVKLDADAVFVPSRLVPFLSGQLVPTKASTSRTARGSSTAGSATWRSCPGPPSTPWRRTSTGARRTSTGWLAWRAASTAQWARTSLRRPAWTSSTSAAARPSKPGRTARARPTAPKTRRRTRSGCQIAWTRKRPSTTR